MVHRENFSRNLPLQFFPARVTKSSHFRHTLAQMDKTLIDTLAIFCAGQHDAFERDAWRSWQSVSAPTNGVAVATVAKYLSMTSWYGFAGELEAIAIELHPQLSSADGFDLAAQACDFDPGQFSVAIRYRLAVQQIERSLQARSCEAPAFFARGSGLSAEHHKISGQAEKSLGLQISTRY
jgi:hypothetical protein